MAAYHTVTEEGKLDYLDEVVAYYDGGKGTVWEHINKSIDFTMNNLGKHGFPLMLSSDWNDMLYKVCREGRGKHMDIHAAWNGALQLAELAKLKGKNTEDTLKYMRVKKLVNEIAWDGKWYRRCITDNGTFIGSEKEPQAKIWLNTQSWAVISGMGTPDRQKKAMDSVKEYLDTDLGIKKIHPAMKDYPSADDPLTYYNKGCGENGSIFCHANTWAVIAECMLGRAENAYKYYRQLLPTVAQTKAGEWRYKAEPYIYSSNIFGPESDKFGLANVSWLTGTAAWMYIAVTQYMFGIKPKWNGLEINPCLPKEMLPARVTRVFRGCRYEITITQNKKSIVSHKEGMEKIEVTV